MLNISQNRATYISTQYRHISSFGCYISRTGRSVAVWATPSKVEGAITSLRSSRKAYLPIERVHGLSEREAHNVFAWALQGYLRQIDADYDHLEIVAACRPYRASHIDTLKQAVIVGKAGSESPTWWREKGALARVRKHLADNGIII